MDKNIKVNFKGDIDVLKCGINEVAPQIGLNEDVSGTCISVERNCENTICVSRNSDGVTISYCEKADFYRALAIAASFIKNGEESFNKTEKRMFEKCGAMLDVSRNAVLNMEGIKKFMRYLALMGHNTLYLYMEDTYRIDGYEYFGYMRGAYTKEELKELVNYADMFGIEVIPCIQTLAHLAKTLKWRYALPMSDTEDILLIDEPETYKFIEAMFKTIKECFKTDRIHIGMDEAHDVGMGEYFRKNGLTDRFTLMSRHLEKVTELTKKYGLKPMMWSDMFFRLGSETGDYYDLNSKMPENISELIPEEMGIVYWDYYNENEQFCDTFIKAHLKMQRQIIFAGGVWIWGSLAPDYRKTFSQTKAALKMCRKNNITEAFATLWGDDGAETSVFESLLGLQLFAEYNFYDEVSDEHLAKMFKICTGCDMDAFMLLGLDGMNENETIKKIDDMWNIVQTTKQLLYQDILMGLFDENYKNEPMGEIYEKVYNDLEKIEHQGEMEYLFIYHRQLVKTLKSKWDIGIRLSKAYAKNDKKELVKLANEIKDIRVEMEKTHELFSDIWLKDNKAFGLDIIDLRLGGVIARCERAAKRALDYVGGKIDRIEELEEKKLLYNNTVVNHDLPMVYEWRFNSITSVQ